MQDFRTSNIDTIILHSGFDTASQDLINQAREKLAEWKASTVTDLLNSIYEDDGISDLLKKENLSIEDVELFLSEIYSYLFDGAYDMDYWETFWNFGLKALILNVEISQIATISNLLKHNLTSLIFETYSEASALKLSTSIDRLIYCATVLVFDAILKELVVCVNSAGVSSPIINRMLKLEEIDRIKNKEQALNI